jgi:hypothetical protein
MKTEYKTNKTSLENSPSEQLRTNAIESLWSVTRFVSAHCAVTMGVNGTSDTINKLAELREIIADLMTLEEANN